MRMQVCSTFKTGTVKDFSKIIPAMQRAMDGEEPGAVPAWFAKENKVETDSAGNAEGASLRDCIHRIGLGFVTENLIWHGMDGDGTGVLEMEALHTNDRKWPEVDLLQQCMRHNEDATNFAVLVTNQKAGKVADTNIILANDCSRVGFSLEEVAESLAKTQEAREEALESQAPGA